LLADTLEEAGCPDAAVLDHCSTDFTFLENRCQITIRGSVLSDVPLHPARILIARRCNFPAPELASCDLSSGV
jgi:hypothetical protein